MLGMQKCENYLDVGVLLVVCEAFIVPLCRETAQNLQAYIPTQTLKEVGVLERVNARMSSSLCLLTRTRRFS